MSCTVRGCRNVWYPGSSVKYHSFPVDPSRRSAWLAEIQVKGLFYNSARICSDHFKLEDYDPERPGKLLKHAVPNYAYKSCECCNSLECPNMPSTSQHKSTTVSNLEHTLPPKINTSDDENKAPILRRLLDVYRENADAKASPVTSAALLPVAGCSVAILHSPTQHITKKDGESPRKRSVLKDINIQTNMRTSREKTLMKENKILKQRVKRQGNKINDMKSIIHVMRSQLEIENILKGNFANICNFLKKKTGKISKNVKYSDEVKAFALTLHFYSPKAYEYLRKVISLPHETTLWRSLSSFN